MIYRFLLLSDEKEKFQRVIDIDSDATFLDFNNIILKSVDYSEADLTTFFTCSDYWEKEQEITRIDMETDSSVDSYLMEETALSDFIEDKGQKLIFIFDMLFERAFFIELIDITFGKSLEKAVCIKKQGVPPIQNSSIDEIITDGIKNGDTNVNIDDEQFYGDNLYNSDEIDNLSDFNEY